MRKRSSGKVEKAERYFWILYGAEKSEKTTLARKTLDEAGIDYIFANVVDDGLDGPMPQLTSGFQSFIGLRRILLYADNTKQRTAYAF